jgi:hypothetical protein
LNGEFTISGIFFNANINNASVTWDGSTFYWRGYLQDKKTSNVRKIEEKSEKCVFMIRFKTACF